MGQVYKHWSDFPMDQWRWPDFSPQELASKGEGELMIDEPSLDRLQALRTALGKPLIITSAYRSLAHNRRIGSKDTSQHRKAKAYDVLMANHDPGVFERAARAAGFTGIGHYPNSRNPFMHIDTGPARRWNDGADFPLTSARAPTPSFPIEPRKETVLDIVKQPGVLMGAGSVVTGAGAVTQGSGPFQYALAVAMLLLVIVFIAWLATRILRRPSDV